VTTFDYTRSRATADRLIARFGMAAILRRPTATGPAYNPTTGTPDDYPCTVVIDSFATSEVADSGGRILADDKKVLLAVGNLPISPAPSDKLVLGGAEYRIIGPDVGKGIETVAPGGTTVMYVLQVRK
jgi:hypothetical protein